MSSKALTKYKCPLVFRKGFNTSRFEPYAGLFRLLMNEIFDAYLLRPFDEKFIFELVMRV